MLFLNFFMPYGLIIIIVGCLLLISLLIFLILKSKKPKIKIDDEFINNLILYLGGIENIIKVDVDNGRLKIALNDYNKADLEKLKENSESGGVFITGNTIKILFKLDSMTIKNAIDKKL